MSLRGSARKRVFRETLTISHLAKYFSAFYGTRWFIIVLEHLVANIDPVLHKYEEFYSIPIIFILTLLNMCLGHPHHLLHASPPKHHAHTFPSSSRVTSRPHSSSLISSTSNLTRNKIMITLTSFSLSSYLFSLSQLTGQRTN